MLPTPYRLRARRALRSVTSTYLGYQSQLSIANQTRSDKQISDVIIRIDGKRGLLLRNAHWNAPRAGNRIHALSSQVFVAISPLIPTPHQDCARKRVPVLCTAITSVDSTVDRADGCVGISNEQPPISVRARDRCNAATDERARPRLPAQRACRRARSSTDALALRQRKAPSSVAAGLDAWATLRGSAGCSWRCRDRG